MGKQVKPEVMDSLKHLVKGIVDKIVDHPESVNVNVIPASYRLLVELHTHSDDVGQVVGKHGNVITSIRSIVAAFAGKHDVRIDVDYVTEKENAARRAAAHK